VYPFNPRVVLDHDPCNEVPIADKITERSLGDSTGEISQLEEASNSTSIIFSFTPEENDKYSTRFAEGYDLYDPKYVARLKANHPEEDCSFLPLAEYFPDAVSPDVLSVSDPGSPIPSVSSQCISVMSASSAMIFTPSRSSTPNSASQSPTQMTSPFTVPTVASTLSTSSSWPNTTIQQSTPSVTLISTSIPSINTQMMFPATASTVSNIAFTSAPTASTYTQSLSYSTVSTPSTVSHFSFSTWYRYSLCQCHLLFNMYLQSQERITALQLESPVHEY